MQASFLERHPGLRDGLNFVIFVLLVLIGTLFINTFVFRSFNVDGSSSWPTLENGDRLIVDRIPVTLAQLQNKTYVPERGQFIIFKNPQYIVGGSDEFIVKRVIAFGGERVVIKDGILTVYNDEHPKGFQPDTEDKNGSPRQPTSNDGDWTVPDGTLFVSGDNRLPGNSLDSRTGLGMIPLYDIIGPVSLRIWPLNKITTL